MKQSTLIALAVAVAASVASDTASAVDYCVTSATDLQAKLTLAASTTADDTIRIFAGSFAAPAGSNGFTYVSSNDGALTLSGGWSGFECALQPGLRTELVGASDRRVLTLSMNAATAGQLTIEDIAFEGGTSPLSGFGGCASLVNPAGEVTLSRNSFRGCVAPLGEGGGVFLQSMSAHAISNLFVHNAARQGGALYIEARGGSFHVNNNTITDNLAEGLSGAAGGLHITASGVNGSASSLWASNNILWGNTSGSNRVDADISGLANASATFRYNHIGPIGGTPSAVSGQSTSGDPLFVNADQDNFRLRAASPALNSGNNNAAGGIGTMDIKRLPRVQGNTVERGAFEFDQLFRHGFE